MPYFLIVVVIMLGLVGIKTSYEKGVADGKKTAINVRAPSDELEMACWALWVGEQNKKYWEKEKNK